MQQRGFCRTDTGQHTHTGTRPTPPTAEPTQAPPPPKPGKATPVAPSGSINEANPTFSWQEATDAAEYQLVVKKVDGSSLFEKWYSKSEVCVSFGCSVKANLNLSAGEYAWLVVARSDNGEGPASDLLSFTVSAPAPAEAPSEVPTETPVPPAPPSDIPVPSETPAPTETPVPSETPAPTETPIPTETPTPTITPTEKPKDDSIIEVNKYFSIKKLSKDGKKFEAEIIHGPSKKPKELSADQVGSNLSADSTLASMLTVPAFNWVFGCSAVSGAMIAGYYDRNGYSNMYTGPTNGGVYPLTEDGSWGNWTDGFGENYPNNPLVASHNGLDGRITRGSIDDYWYYYGSSANDPYITNSWTQHAWGTAIGDYMKTSQSSYSNTDGSTTFYTWTSSAGQLTCAEMPSLAISTKDGTYGRKLFYESHGYTVTECYNQRTDNSISGGFSLAQYQSEINAGRPVMINLVGHTIVGVGYLPSTSTIYIHDTWDNSDHTMTWGGSYSGMAMRSVSIVNLTPTVPGAPLLNQPASAALTSDTTPDFSWFAATNGSYYRIRIANNSGFSSPLVDATLGAGQLNYTPGTPLSPDGTWYWQVQAFNTFGAGPWSAARTLSVDTTPHLLCRS